MEEFLGVFVEPWEIDGNTRHDKIHDALYGFEEKCVASENIQRYGAGHFDLVEHDELQSYWESSDAEKMFVAGHSESLEALFRDLDISPENVVFENYTVSGFVDSPSNKQVLIDEFRSLLPFQERGQLVEENTAYEKLEQIGVPDADVMYLRDVAQPPERSMYYASD